MHRRRREAFRWGVAGSAFQSEGDMPRCNWGVYLSDGKHPKLEPYRDSIDFRHRYREDVVLAKDLGANVFRFGVNWARVEPTPGAIDEEAWAFYRDVVSAIVDAGMEPMPMLDHFVYPEWIFDRGGWLNPSTVDFFTKYVEVAIDQIGAFCPWWLIVNEPSISILLETKMRDLAPEQGLEMAANLVDAHRRSYELVKATHKDARVSSNEATGNLPLPVRTYADALFLDQVAADHLDFIGLDVYYPDLTAEGMAQIDSGAHWLVPQPPDGIGPIAEYYTHKYPGLPVFIIETGMPTDNGRPRPDGLTRRQHLLNAVDSIHHARQRGIPLIGMLYWSLTDNYEWGSYRPRFGLYSVDVVGDPTLTRVPTDAVETFKTVIASINW